MVIMIILFFLVFFVFEKKLFRRKNKQKFKNQVYSFIFIHFHSFLMFHLFKSEDKKMNTTEKTEKTEKMEKITSPCCYPSSIYNDSNDNNGGDGKNKSNEECNEESGKKQNHQKVLSFQTKIKPKHSIFEKKEENLNKKKKNDDKYEENQFEKIKSHEELKQRLKMSKDIPNEILIQHKIFRNVTAKYSKDGKITFQTPNSLKGRIENDCFNACLALGERNPIFPFLWDVLNENHLWTVYEYEKQISLLKKNNFPKKEILFDETKSEEEVDNGGDFVDSGKKKQLEQLEQSDQLDQREDLDEKIIENPYQVDALKWSSLLISKWINSNQKPLLQLKEITHFRRYDVGRCFEFLCVWYRTEQKNDQDTVRVWVKYIDLCSVDVYKNYLDNIWSILKEEKKNWEELIVDNNMNIDKSDDEYSDEIDMVIKQMKEPSSKKRKHDNRKTKNPTKKKFEPNASDEDGGSDDASGDSFHDGVNEQDSGDDNDEDDNEIIKESILKETVNKVAKKNKIPWQPIFGLSCVDPVPRYQIKSISNKLF